MDLEISRYCQVLGQPGTNPLRGQDPLISNVWFCGSNYGFNSWTISMYNYAICTFFLTSCLTLCSVIIHDWTVLFFCFFFQIHIPVLTPFELQWNVHLALFFNVNCLNWVRIKEWDRLLCCQHCGTHFAAHVNQEPPISRPTLPRILGINLY